VNKNSMYYLLAAFALSITIAFTGCSRQEEEQAVEEKGSIEKMTDEAADKAVKKIRSPINKARGTSNLGDERLEEMDKALQKQ
jgi:hypothetical protein